MTTLMRGIPAFFEPNVAALRGTQALRRRRGGQLLQHRASAPYPEHAGRLRVAEDSATRLTVGAVNACTGAMRYFDSRKERLCVEHVMASGALPPAFPAVRIEGEPYWDGGIYSNTPIEAVLDDKPRRDSLIFAVNVWHQTGPEPESIWQVIARQKDIQYASRADSPHRPAEADPSVAPRDPAAGQRVPGRTGNPPACAGTGPWGCRTTMHVVHLLAPRLEGEDHTKDIDFTPAGMRTRRAGRVCRHDAHGRARTVDGADRPDRRRDRARLNAISIPERKENSDETHPVGSENMTERFDAIVIGPARPGPALARGSTGEGLKTALIERTALGGTCVNDGCIPTKTLVAARARCTSRAAAPSTASQRGRGPRRHDAVKARKDGVVDHSRRGLASWIERHEERHA